MSIPAAQDHANHVKPTHNSDGWIWCDECGGWVVHQPSPEGYDSRALTELALYVKDLFDGGHFNSRLGRLQQETLEDFIEAALPSGTNNPPI
jgi:hypothetical protein